MNVYVRSDIISYPEYTPGREGLGCCLSYPYRALNSWKKWPPCSIIDIDADRRVMDAAGNSDA